MKPTDPISPFAVHGFSKGIKIYRKTELCRKIFNWKFLSSVFADQQWLLHGCFIDSAAGGIKWIWRKYGEKNLQKPAFVFGNVSQLTSYLDINAAGRQKSRFYQPENVHKLGLSIFLFLSRVGWVCIKHLNRDSWIQLQKKINYFLHQQWWLDLHQKAIWRKYFIQFVLRSCVVCSWKINWKSKCS